MSADDIITKDMYNAAVEEATKLAPVLADIVWRTASNVPAGVWSLALALKLIASEQGIPEEVLPRLFTEGAKALVKDVMVMQPGGKA